MTTSNASSPTKATKTDSTAKAAKISEWQRVLADLEKSHPGAPAADLDFFVMAILGGAIPERVAAFRRLREWLVDWNEARVARMVEMARLLDPLPEADTLAFRLRAALNKLFDLRGAMELSFLADMRLGEARRIICSFDKDFTKQVADQILSAITDAVWPPISAAALQGARRQGLLPSGKNSRWLQQRLADELSPSEAARLVFLLELTEAERRAPDAKRRMATKKRRNMRRYKEEKNA